MLEKFNRKKEVLIKLNQSAVRKNLYLAFDRFTVMAEDEGFEKSLKNGDSGDDSYSERRMVKVYVIEFEEQRNQRFNGFKKRVKARTLVNKINISSKDARMVFIKDMINMKKGFKFEDSTYYKKWECERYMDCKLEEATYDLETA